MFCIVIFTELLLILQQTLNLNNGLTRKPSLIGGQWLNLCLILLQLNFKKCYPILISLRGSAGSNYIYKGKLQQVIIQKIFNLLSSKDRQ